MAFADAYCAPRISGRPGLLTTDGLRARIGVARTDCGEPPGVQRLFDAALRVLREAGAVLIELGAAGGPLPAPDALWRDELTVLLAELKDGLERDLTRPGAATASRTR